MGLHPVKPIPTPTANPVNLLNQTLRIAVQCQFPDVREGQNAKECKADKPSASGHFAADFIQFLTLRGCQTVHAMLRDFVQDRIYL